MRKVDIIIHIVYAGYAISQKRRRLRHVILDGVGWHYAVTNLRLLVDPIELGILVLEDLTLLKP